MSEQEKKWEEMAKKIFKKRYDPQSSFYRWDDFRQGFVAGYIEARRRQKEVER